MNNHGGARKGAGRKRLAPEPLKKYTFRIRPEAENVLKKQKNKSLYINTAIIEKGERKNGLY